MNVHPDLDALSASLDGEDEAARAHVDACPECAARVASLAAVREAVAQPVAPLDAERREQALAAALAAFDGEEAAGGEGASVVSLPSRRWQWAAGSAVAAVLVLLVGMAALFGRGGEREATDTALRAPVAESDAKASAGANNNAAGAATVGDGGDLGDLASADALRSRYSAGLFLAPTSGQSTATGRATGGPSAGATGAAAGPAPSVPPPVAVGTRACELEARAARPQVGVVVYAATARFQGVPAVVLGFGPTAGSPPTVLLVLAPGQGCRLLGETAVP